MTKINPAKFIREVRQESGRVTWPTRKETSMFTIMVFTMATFAALFFVLVDWIISSAVGAIIGL